MSRQIKDIKDKNTGLLVYPRTHISAVAVSSGITLEDSLEMSKKVNNIIKSDGDGNSYLANDGTYKEVRTDFTSIEQQLENKLSKTEAESTYQPIGNYATKTELNTAITEHLEVTDALNAEISNKQDKLVSGTTIKTINGESILGEGDFTIQTEANVKAINTTKIIEDVETNTYVKYVTLILTEELQALVRANIGAVSLETFNGLSGYVTIDVLSNYVTTGTLSSYATIASLSSYATIAYVNSLIGNINSVLESIINS